jgi:hypothetical protein
LEKLPVVVSKPIDVTGDGNVVSASMVTQRRRHRDTQFSSTGKLKEETMDFWEVHGWVFVLCMFFFPRLTMLLGTAVTAGFGVLGWLGWVFMPRLTVAILATGKYWDTNEVLVVFTWIWALGGEGTEKKAASNRVSRSE